MPPAVQIDTRQRPPPRCFSSFAAVATMRAPVAANGWPAASEEPSAIVYRLEAIRVVGNRQTGEHVVRRYVAVREGEPLDVAAFAPPQPDDTEPEALK